MIHKRKKVSFFGARVLFIFVSVFVTTHVSAQPENSVVKKDSPYFLDYATKKKPKNEAPFALYKKMQKGGKKLLVKDLRKLKKAPGMDKVLRPNTAKTGYRIVGFDEKTNRLAFVVPVGEDNLEQDVYLLELSKLSKGFQAITGFGLPSGDRYMSREKNKVLLVRSGIPEIYLLDLKKPGATPKMIFRASEGTTFWKLSFVSADLPDFMWKDDRTLIVKEYSLAHIQQQYSDYMGEEMPDLEPVNVKEVVTE